MKELVGHIYRDEDGVETIERIQKRISDWEISLIDEPCPYDCTVEYGFQARCPKCGAVLKFWNKSTYQRDHSMESFANAKRHTYCGTCGCRNIH